MHTNLQSLEECWNISKSLCLWRWSRTRPLAHTLPMMTASSSSINDIWSKPSSTWREYKKKKPGVAYNDRGSDHHQCHKFSDICFWDLMPYSPFTISRRCGGTYPLYLQGRGISQARNQQLFFLGALRWFLAWLILRSWGWRRHVVPKHRLTFNRLHGVTSQKITFFKITAVTTSTPMHLFLFHGVA
jgi:hypothetical protein